MLSSINLTVAFYLSSNCHEDKKNTILTSENMTFMSNDIFHHGRP